MAVDHSAASESHTGTTGSTNQASFSWTHTQTGTPQGVLVFVHTISASDFISSVTYGGTALTRVSGGVAIDTAGEPGRTDLFFLGSGLASGNQTITVNRTNNATIMYASAATVTAATNTNVTGIVLLQGDGGLAVQSVTDGGAPTNSLRYAGAYSGLASPPPAGAGSRLLTSIDFGNYGCALVREITAGTGAGNVGFNNATTDDRAAVHVAVRELWNRSDTQTVGSFTLTGNAATLTVTSPKVIEPIVGAFTLTGNAADLRHNPDIEAGVGAFALTGNPAGTRHNVRLEGGTGTFALTGNPAGTRHNVQTTGDLGKFFLPERNLLTHSEAFDNAAWTKQATTVSANSTTGPDGSSTADAVYETSAIGEHYARRTVSGLQANTLHTVSVYIKDLGGRNCRIRVLDLNNVSNGYFATFSPASGTVVQAATSIGSGSASSASITSAGSGWYRINLTGNGGTTCTSYIVDFYSVNVTTVNYAGDTTKGLFLWGAELEEGSTLTDYDPTGAAAATPAGLKVASRIVAESGGFTLTGNPAALAKVSGKELTAATGAFALASNGATVRHNVQITGERGQLFLPERNMRLWSESFNNAAWLKTNTSVTTNATTAPDGTLTADALIENTTPSVGHFVSREITYVAGRTYTASCYFKLYPGPITRYARLQLGDATVFGADTYININLASGTVASAVGSPSASGITNEGNGWYRAWLTKQYTGAGVTQSPIIQIIATSGTGQYTDADGLSGIYIWGAQFEEGSLSDYDPTGPVAATRTDFKVASRIVAETGSFTLTGSNPQLNKGRTLAAETAAFTLASNGATLRRGYALTAQAGAFTATGQPATLRHNPRIEAATGAFALTGGSPALLRGRYLSGGAGTFIETGQPVTFRRTWAIQAGTGAFSLTGNPASLTELGAYEIDAIAGSFALSGQPATLAQSQTMPVTAGTFALSGQPATLRHNPAITAGRGQFTLSGQASTLTQGHALTASTGAFALTGQPASLGDTDVLDAAAGAFAFTGNPAGLNKSSALGGGTGAFTLTGNPASLSKQSAKQLAADAGDFAIAGNTATLSRSRLFAADRGQIALTGGAAAIVAKRALFANAGALALTGSPAALKATRLLAVSTGSFALTGQSANLTDTDELYPAVGTFALTGLGAELLKTGTARRRNVLIF